MRSSSRKGPLLLLILAWAASSCRPPESKHPLSDPAAAKADPRLLGLWAGNLNGSEATLQVIPKAGGHCDLVLTGTDEDKGAVVLTFDAFPTQLGGRSYLNLRAKRFGDDYGDRPELDPSYIFARYELSKDGALTLWHMDEEPVKEAIAAGKLEGRAGERSVRLTASIEKLAAFVTATDPERLFTRLGTFRKLRR